MDWGVVSRYGFLSTIWQRSILRAGVDDDDSDEHAACNQLFDRVWPCDSGDGRGVQLLCGGRGGTFAGFTHPTWRRLQPPSAGRRWGPSYSKYFKNRREYIFANFERPWNHGRHVDDVSQVEAVYRETVRCNNTIASEQCCQDVSEDFSAGCELGGGRNSRPATVEGWERRQRAEIFPQQEDIRRRPASQSWSQEVFTTPRTDAGLPRPGEPTPTRSLPPSRPPHDRAYNPPPYHRQRCCSHRPSLSISHPSDCQWPEPAPASPWLLSLLGRLCIVRPVHHLHVRATTVPLRGSWS